MKKILKRKKGEKLIFKDGKIKVFNAPEEEIEHIKKNKDISNNTNSNNISSYDRSNNLNKFDETKETESIKEEPPKNKTIFKISKMVLGVFLIIFLFVIFSIAKYFINDTRTFLKVDDINTNQKINLAKSTIKDFKNETDKTISNANKKAKKIQEQPSQYNNDIKEKSKAISQDDLSEIYYIISMSNQLTDIITNVRDKSSSYINNETTNITVSSFFNTYKSTLSELKDNLNLNMKNTSDIQTKQILNILNNRLENINKFIDNANSSLDNKDNLANICNKHISLENSLLKNQIKELRNFCDNNNITYQSDENGNLNVETN